MSSTLSTLLSIGEANVRLRVFEVLEKKVSRDDPRIVKEWAVKDAIDFRNRIL